MRHHLYIQLLLLLLFLVQTYTCIGAKMDSGFSCDFLARDNCELEACRRACEADDCDEKCVVLSHPLPKSFHCGLHNIGYTKYDVCPEEDPSNVNYKGNTKNDEDEKDEDATNYKEITNNKSNKKKKNKRRNNKGRRNSLHNRKKHNKNKK